jgi:hypothetical protein
MLGVVARIGAPSRRAHAAAGIVSGAGCKKRSLRRLSKSNGAKCRDPPAPALRPRVGDQKNPSASAW